MIIHNVGNKVKGESLEISTEICDANNEVTNQYLKQFFFSTFKFDVTYRFVHETDIAMNEIYNYVKHIFENPSEFYEQSVNIAKHLYEVSVHPNIKAGELYIVYLQNCIIDDNVTDAIGIYKSESKDYYLQVNSNGKRYDIECQQGINPKKLDKGCLIFNLSDSNYKVYIVDRNINDAMYWKKNFLMIEEEKNEYTNTAKVLKSCKKYIAKKENIEPEKRLELMNNSVEYFENNEEFDLEKFTEKVFDNQEESDKFKVYIDSYDIDNKFSIANNSPNGFLEFEAVKNIEIGPDRESKQPLPDSAKWMNGSVKNIIINSEKGETLENVEYISDPSYHDVLILRQVQAQYRFEFGEMNGFCIIEYGFPHYFRKYVKGDAFESRLANIYFGKTSKSQNVKNATRLILEEFEKLYQTQYHLCLKR